MKINKFYEYSSHDNKTSIRYYLDKIESDAENGILPIDSIKDEKLLKKLKKHFRYFILNATITANNNKHKTNKFDAPTKTHNSTINFIGDAEDHEYVFTTILNSLKKGIPLDDILNQEFPGENPVKIMSLLTDHDKEIINKYHEEMSKNPKNQKSFNQFNQQNKYNNSVIDPFEDFYNSAPYKKYSDKIRKFNDE